MNTPTEADMFDMFNDWLEKDYLEYSKEEITELWNEFEANYPDNLENWEFVKGE